MLLITMVVGLIMGGVTVYRLLWAPNFHPRQTVYLYIDQTKDYARLCQQLKDSANCAHLGGFKWLSSWLKYPEHMRTGRYAVHEVDLTKDTNVLVCQVVPASGSGDVSIDRYGVQLKSSNGVLDACNNTVPSSLVVYAPYKMQADRVEDDLNGQVETLGYAIKTLRLVQGDNSRLVLNDNDSGNVILDLPLTDFLCQIASFYTQSGRPLTAQEYLDRQDFHTVILYMSESGNSVVQCRINNWVIRLNDNINL